MQIRLGRSLYSSRMLLFLPPKTTFSIAESPSLILVTYCSNVTARKTSHRLCFQCSVCFQQFKCLLLIMSIAHYLQAQHDPPFKYCQAHIHIHLLAWSLTLLSLLSLKDFLIAKTFRHFDCCFNIPYQKTQAQVYITKSIQQQSPFNDSCANCVQGTEKAHGSN